MIYKRTTITTKTPTNLTLIAQTQQHINIKMGGIKEKFCGKNVTSIIPKMVMVFVCLITFTLIIVSATSNTWGESTIYYERRGMIQVNRKF